MIEAMLAGDKAFDGLFYTGVKTTKIYCLPSCYAKKPYPENVVFFHTADEAEKHHFRACKKCFPDLPQDLWIDNKDHIALIPPSDFNFQECLVFLGRSDAEVLHLVHEKSFYKCIKIQEKNVLMKVFMKQEKLVIEFPDFLPNKFSRLQAAKYIWNLFDLDCDPEPFYKLAEKDAVLNPIVSRHHGLRIIGIPDLFEALSWAIMGQQINLNFAYTLKRRLTEVYGENYEFDGKTMWIFPEPETISALNVSDLQNLQFTTRKAEYILGIARAISEGTLSKEHLLLLEKEEARNFLLSIRGVGGWTADYVLMKCLKDPSAFPIADVGLHNALKTQLGLDRKPSIEEILKISAGWKGWEAYAVFYLWRSLYN
jgi:DNA-3-methyladenine glycosylase II